MPIMIKGQYSAAYRTYVQDGKFSFKGKLLAEAGTSTILNLSRLKSMDSDDEEESIKKKVKISVYEDDILPKLFSSIEPFTLVKKVVIIFIYCFIFISLFYRYIYVVIFSLYNR